MWKALFANLVSKDSKLLYHYSNRQEFDVAVEEKQCALQEVKRLQIKYEELDKQYR